MADTEHYDKLQALERRVEQMEQLFDTAIDIMELAETATRELRDRAIEALQAIVKRLDEESRCFRTRGIEVVNAAGQPMVTIKATDFGGSLALRAGSGEEAVDIGVNEDSCGIMVARDPGSGAMAGLHVTGGCGELLTVSKTGHTCSVAPAALPPQTEPRREC